MPAGISVLCESPKLALSTLTTAHVWHAHALSVSFRAVVGSAKPR